MKDPEKLTKRERIDWSLLVDAMQMVEDDLLTPVLAQGRIPPDWHAIAAEGVTPGKTRITARLDADVVKFFRGLGPGYQAKINRVLRSFMLARVTGLVEGHERREIVDKMLKYRDPDVLRAEIGTVRRYAEGGLDAARRRPD